MGDIPRCPWGIRVWETDTKCEHTKKFCITEETWNYESWCLEQSLSGENESGLYYSLVGAFGSRGERKDCFVSKQTVSTLLSLECDQMALGKYTTSTFKETLPFNIS